MNTFLPSLRSSFLMFVIDSSDSTRLNSHSLQNISDSMESEAFNALRYAITRSVARKLFVNKQRLSDPPESFEKNLLVMFARRSAASLILSKLLPEPIAIFHVPAPVYGHGEGRCS